MRQYAIFWSLGLMLMATLASSQPKFVIVKDRQGRCGIVVIQNVGEKRMALAKELQHWLKEVTGATLPIQTMPPVQRGIILGLASEFPKQEQKERLAKLGQEGFVIRSENDRLWLLANTELGLQHAVYAFLETIGCRWYFPDPVWTVVPKKPNLALQLNLRQKPAFVWRNIWYGWGPRTPKLHKDYEAWTKRNRHYGHFPVDCGHAYERYIPHREFEKHPELFALVGGKRQPTQLCVSNPEVQKRVIEGVLNIFRRDPNRIMVSVDPNDGGGHCECENCKAIGSPSDQAFFLANKVAEVVRKEFPDKWVGLYAYAHHSDPPQFQLLPGIYVEVTTGFRYTKLTFDEQVEAFRKLGATIGVRDYFSVYPWDFDLPGAAKAGRFYELADAIRNYHRLDMVSYTAESSCNWGPNGLGYWMAAKLMWQPDLDLKALVDDFCRNAFSKAAPSMRRIYERWAKGERFSPRSLKLALLDLQEAYQLEDDLPVRARLDRIAMYLHFLRLWLDYDRSARWNQWGRLVVARPEEIKERARQVIVYARHIMDTGLIHTYPMLFASDWFAHRFAGLLKLEGIDKTEVEGWKMEHTDIPTAEEVANDFADDLRHFANLPAVEILGREFKGKLVPIVLRRPDLVRAWGEVHRSPLFVESGEHYFWGRKGEHLRLTYTPFNSGHTVDCRWMLKSLRDGKVITQGDVKAETGKAATTEEIILPSDAVFSFEPGTNYWKAAQIGFDERPLSVWAGRFDEPGKPRRMQLRLWLPQNEPLYFFVPKETKHFVIGIVSGGDPYTALELRAADGTIILREQVVTNDQISVIVEDDVRQYGALSEMAKHAVLPSQQTSVRVPKGKDGQILSLSLRSLRCGVELYDVPPYFARHPGELLVPEDALR